MSGPEILSRLNPKNIDLQPIPSSAEAITAMDIAGSLGIAKVRQGASVLIRFKWSKHPIASEMLSSLYTSLSDVTDFKQWCRISGHRPELIMDLCRMAIVEYCQCPLCKTCQGTKVRPEVIDDTPTGKVITCPTCGGYGTKPRSRQEMIREHLKMEPRNFNRGWHRLYKQAFDILSEFEQEGLKGLFLK